MPHVATWGHRRQSFPIHHRARQWHRWPRCAVPRRWYRSTRPSDLGPPLTPPYGAVVDRRTSHRGIGRHRGPKPPLWEKPRRRCLDRTVAPYGPPGRAPALDCLHRHPTHRRGRHGRRDQSRVRPDRVHRTACGRLLASNRPKHPQRRHRKHHLTHQSSCPEWERLRRRREPRRRPMWVVARQSDGPLALPRCGPRRALWCCVRHPRLSTPWVFSVRGG